MAKSYRLIGNIVETTLGISTPVDIPWAMSFGASAPPPPPPPAPPGDNIAGDIIDEDGLVVQSAYEDMALNYSHPTKGLLYRFGQAATATGVPTLSQRADLGNILYGSQARIYYQYGGPPTEVNNDFVSSHGAAVFRPASGSSVNDAVGRFCTYQIDRHTISQRPQLMWNSAQLLPPQVQSLVSQGILSTSEPADLPVLQYRWAGPADAGATRMSIIATNGSMTRGARLFTVGTETAPQLGSCILTPGKIPTSVTITSGGEFALVTVWDLTAFKGQVAVIALGSSPAGTTWQQTNLFYDWWHDFTDMTHPGFKNKGGWSFMKVIGYVDLPTDMKAPTSCHAYTGLHPYEIVYHDDGGGQLSISGMNKEASPMDANRARMLDYNDFGKWISKGGCLAVASFSEKKICFLDLKPLFVYFNDMYLGSAAKNLETQYYRLSGTAVPGTGVGVDGDKYLRTSTRDVYKRTSGTWAVIGTLTMGYGMGVDANQWPFQLSDVPSSAATPTIIKTITVPDNPVGIRSPISWNYWSKDNTRREPGTPGYPYPDPHYPRMWVVGRTGTLRIYSMGKWVPGSKPADGTPNASEIAEVGTVAGLGEQVTDIFSVKDYDIDLQGIIYHEQDAPPGSLDEMVGVVDRKNRKINWVQFAYGNGNSGYLHSSLRDSRMDPITVDHVDGYYKTNKVILVTDYTGQCVRTYRARTPVPLTYDGTAYPTLDTGGEYGGAYTVPGYPFSAATSNAP